MINVFLHIFSAEFFFYWRCYCFYSL